jgi:hypothetical protein
MAKESNKSKENKPDYDRLSCRVQVLLKPNEFKIFDRIRRESMYSSPSAYLRSLILLDLKKKNQLELFPVKK